MLSSRVTIQRRWSVSAALCWFPLTSLALVLGSTLATAPPASAVSTMHAGALCKPLAPGDAAYVLAYPNGTYIVGAPSAIDVTCPLVRTTTNVDGAHLVVNFTLPSSGGQQTIACTAGSYDSTGALLRADGAQYTGNGAAGLVLDLFGRGHSAAQSTYSVSCGVSPGTIIHGIELREY